MDPNVRVRLIALAGWHDDMGRHPMDVSGSDASRHRRAKFHLDAANDIRTMLRELER